MSSTASEYIVNITDNGSLLCSIIHAALVPETTTFFTGPELTQQVGYVVYPAGGEIVGHTHLPIERHLVGTSEVLVVRKGRCLADIYNDQHELIASSELREGDIMIMLGGGHGFRILEDTILLEIKQGPYSGIEEKERF